MTRTAAIAAILLATGCGAGEEEIASSSAATEPLATLTLSWTVAGSTDAPACSRASAAVIDVSIVSPETGVELEVFQERCNSFATSMQVVPGTYAVRTRLLDATGKPRTADIAIDPVTLAGDAIVLRTVDFSAFL